MLLTLSAAAGAARLPGLACPPAPHDYETPHHLWRIHRANLSALSLLLSRTTRHNRSVPVPISISNVHRQHISDSVPPARIITHHTTHTARPISERRIASPTGTPCYPSARSSSGSGGQQQPPQQPPPSHHHRLAVIISRNSSYRSRPVPIARIPTKVLTCPPRHACRHPLLGRPASATRCPLSRPLSSLSLCSLSLHSPTHSLSRRPNRPHSAAAPPRKATRPCSPPCASARARRHRGRSSCRPPHTARPSAVAVPSAQS